MRVQSRSRRGRAGCREATLRPSSPRLCRRRRPPPAACPPPVASEAVAVGRAARAPPARRAGAARLPRRPLHLHHVEYDVFLLGSKGLLAALRPMHAKRDSPRRRGVLVLVRFCVF
jgi:hypothetical protein